MAGVRKLLYLVLLEIFTFLLPNVNAQAADDNPNTADRSPSVSGSANILLAAGGTVEMKLWASRQVAEILWKRDLMSFVTTLRSLTTAKCPSEELDELVTQVRNLAWEVMNKTNDATSSLMQGKMWKAVRHALKDISFEKKSLLLTTDFMEDGQCIYDYDFVPKIRQLQNLSISLDVWLKILKQLSVSLSDTIDIRKTIFEKVFEHLEILKTEIEAILEQASLTSAYSSTATADNFYATARSIIKSIVVNIFDYVGWINLVHQLDPSGDLSRKLEQTKQLLAVSHRLLHNLKGAYFDQTESILWPRTTLVSLEAYTDFFRLFHSTDELMKDKVETVADRTWNTDKDLQTMWNELLGDPPKRAPINVGALVNSMEHRLQNIKFRFSNTEPTKTFVLH